VTTQSVLFMTNYGITDRLNVMAGLPYIWTDSDVSYLGGQRGIQDLSVWVKYQAWQHEFKSGDEFKVQFTGGLSTPLSKYVPDFLPFSIGFQSKTASLRGILYYKMENGLYALAQGSHTWRSNANSDRDSYLYHDELIYSDEVPVPNMVDAGARLGFINDHIQAEVAYDYFTGLTGDDIRYNDMPFLTNKMQAASVGVFAKYHFGPFAVQASANQVFSGRNVGKGTTYSGGLLYFFDLPKKVKTDQ
jgi:Putative MetA-pathway of phenol degradation